MSCEHKQFGSAIAANKFILYYSAFGNFWFSIDNHTLSVVEVGIRVCCSIHITTKTNMSYDRLMAQIWSHKTFTEFPLMSVSATL